MSNPSWIHDLIDEVLPDVETPYSYLYWSLMTCISAAAANNYFISSFKGNYLYYPNIYVILFGESGIGKGFGITLAKKMLMQADITRVIAGRSSIQAIVKELATTKSAAGKALITDSRGIIINGELSTAVISDADSLTILTDLFDRNDNPTWTNMLKGDGHEKLKDPYVTCLFGSSPSHFYEKIPQANIEGGYIGRNLIIYEEHRSKDIDPLSDGLDELEADKFMNILAPKYVPRLIEISKAEKTRVFPVESARKLYNSWRKEWRASQSKYNDKTGFINRVPDHVLKIAMCLTLSRNEELISEESMKEAIDSIVNLVYSTQRTAEGTGIDETAKQTKKVIDILLSSKDNQLSRREMLIAGYGNFDGITLDRIIDTLLDMKWLVRERIGVGSNSDWLLKLAGEPLRSYQKFRESRSKS